MKLSVIIPVYNEEPTIREILEKVTRTPHEKEIIVVDDGSSDGTVDVLHSLESTDQFPDARFLFFERNRGKGAAVREGIRTASGEIVLIQDADLEYDPNDYPALLGPILAGKADVVYGSRFLGGPHRVLFYWHYLGNLFLTMVSNMLTNINLTDMETGFKVFRKDVLDRIYLEENRFGFEPEITAKVAKLGCRIYEVPISYWGRDYSEGKKITWEDGVATLYFVFKYNIFSRGGKKL